MEKKLIFDYMDRNKVNTHVEVDYDTQTISYINYTDDPVEMAFGLNEVTMDSLEQFFRDRLFPETRFNKREVLKSGGFDFFAPKEMIMITHGTQFADTNWIRFEGEKLTYEDVKVRK